MIEIRCATLKKIGDDIIFIRFKDDYTVELEDAIEVNNAYDQLAQEKKVYSILDAKQLLVNFTREALQYLSKDAPFVKKQQILASAYIVDNLSNRIIGKLFIRFNKPPFETKIVADYESAMNWISEMRSV